MSTSASDASTYNDYVSASVDLSQGHHSPATGLSFVRSVRDIDSNKRWRYLYHIADHASTFASPCELNDRVQIRIPSPSGNKIAVIVSHDVKEQVLEVWTSGGQ
jgi:hypothetical protein